MADAWRPKLHRIRLLAAGGLFWLDGVLRRLMMRRLMREIGPERLRAAGLTAERLERQARPVDSDAR
jgi:hypothetical protein